MTTQPEETIEQDLNEDIAAVEAHPVFDAMDSLGDFQTFFEHHVYAVWDFMTLLEAFQNPDGRIQLWTSPVCYESGDDLIHQVGYRALPNGVEAHLDAYWNTMDVIGANTRNLHVLFSALEDGVREDEALATAGVSHGVRQHVQTTREIAQTGNPTRIAGAILARRDLIPEGFGADLQRFHQATLNEPQVTGEALETPRCYTTFDQAVEFDWERHRDRILGDDRLEMSGAAQSDLLDAAKQMLDARGSLLDDITNSIQNGNHVNDATPLGGEL
jgi:hypothetical protein